MEQPNSTTEAKDAGTTERLPAPCPTICYQDSLRLFSVSDIDPDPCETFGWWEAVWAATEAEALEWANANYGGECPKGEDPGIRVVSVMDQNKRSKPEQAAVHRERRMSVLRDAGWREEGESACDCCGLYAIGYSEYRVCGECYLCPECRADEPDDPCEGCSS